VELRALFDQVLRVVGRQVRSVATLELDYEPGLPEVVVPAARLAQVFINVLINAAQAVSQVAKPQHNVRISARSDGETVAVSISDTGPGIPPGVVPRIFEPFFTTKERGAGTGLGLSISRSIMRRFGGDLLVDSVHGDGATFIVLIPRPTERDLTAAAERSRSMPIRLGPSAARRSVLVAEPDARVLRAIARSLEPHFDMVGVASAEQAIRHAASGQRFDAVIADVSPPDFVGTALYRFLRDERSELLKRLIFMVGEEQEAPAELAGSTVPQLTKPIGQKALLRALHGQVR
jgi:CheY-like chemotaxis protein